MFEMLIARNNRNQVIFKVVIITAKKKKKSVKSIFQVLITKNDSSELNV